MKKSTKSVLIISSILILVISLVGILFWIAVLNQTIGTEDYALYHHAKAEPPCYVQPTPPISYAETSTVYLDDHVYKFKVLDVVAYRNSVDNEDSCWEAIDTFTNTGSGGGWSIFSYDVEIYRDNVLIDTIKRPIADPSTCQDIRPVRCNSISRFYDINGNVYKNDDDWTTCSPLEIPENTTGLKVLFGSSTLRTGCSISKGGLQRLIVANKIEPIYDNLQFNANSSGLYALSSSNRKVNFDIQVLGENLAENKQTLDLVSGLNKIADTNNDTQAFLVKYSTLFNKAEGVNIAYTQIDPNYHNTNIEYLSVPVQKASCEKEGCPDGFSCVDNKCEEKKKVSVIPIIVGSIIFAFIILTALFLIKRKR